jgi:carbonic anhydrase/acetyltransferase-like protein (isoleucine patch superfamily)
MRTLFTLPIILLLSGFSYTQKQVYIPVEWTQSGFDYSMNRSAESANFIAFWGPLAGQDPTQAPADIAFDPQEVLQTAEKLYTFYIDSMQFVPDTGGLISQWKMILVLLHTWPGIEGWAFGGNYDGVTGAMWMHPHAASDGPTLAHEFAHALQNYTWMMYPGNSFVNHDYVGSFWETHAEFMALQYYPSVALQFDMSRWMNTCQFHWSSTRHHYQAFVFLQFVKENDGLELINRMWREAIIGEHPLQTYMRLKNIDQQALNDLFGTYAMRNVTWDYAIGDLLRERVATIPPVFNLNPTIIPEAIDTAAGLYQIQDHRAPQDYGYNIIQLHPKDLEQCAERIIQVQLNGYAEPAADAGWRWGLVAVDAAGTPRYSDLMRDHGDLLFEWLPTDQELYLVVSGAPRQHHNYAWEAGFPRIFRYPYAFRLRGAVPEGYQPGFSRVPEGTAGAPHPNGGGFVAQSAYAAPSAYVGPGACVLGQARVLDGARVLDHAVIRDNAQVSGQAQVTGFALVGENARISGQAAVGDRARVWGGCEVTQSGQVRGHSVIFSTKVRGDAELDDNVFCWGADLSGSVRLGGDAEYFRPCAAGVYMQVQGAYGRDCDGLSDHPANISLNQPYSAFGMADVPWTSTPDCWATVGTRSPSQQQASRVYPNPFAESLIMACEQAQFWRLTDVQGRVVGSGTLQEDAAVHRISLPSLPVGMYLLQVSAAGRIDTHQLVRTH